MPAASTAADFFAHMNPEQPTAAASVFAPSAMHTHKAEHSEPAPAFFSVTSTVTHVRASALPPPLPEASASHNPPPLHAAPPTHQGVAHEAQTINGGQSTSSFFSGSSHTRPPLFGCV